MAHTARGDNAQSTRRADEIAEITDAAHRQLRNIEHAVPSLLTMYRASMPGRPLVVYFHGMPGSPRELELFGRHPSAALYAPDRTRRDGSSSTCLLDGIAAAIRTRCPDGDVRIIGFSLGTRPALQVATRLGPLVTGIDLVSPAAPLELGDYPNMAGRGVFRLAGTSPRLFSLLVGLQVLAAQRARTALYRSLFATARGADVKLARRQQFQATMKSVLADCFHGDASGYRAEVLAYVSPWSDVLAHVRQPVTLWHGEADSWAPIGMTDAFRTALPNVVEVRRFPHLSHFSTLEVALRERLRT